MKHNPFCILHSTYAFSISIDSTGQRTDGSKLWDIWYGLDGITDCVEIIIKPVTESARFTKTSRIWQRQTHTTPKQQLPKITQPMISQSQIFALFYYSP